MYRCSRPCAPGIKSRIGTSDLLDFHIRTDAEIEDSGHLGPMHLSCSCF